MEETLAEVALDLSGRPAFVFNVAFPSKKIGGFDVELVHESLRSFANAAKMNLHVNVRYGGNSHHVSEAIFKALAKALRQAMAVDERGRSGAINKGDVGGVRGEGEERALEVEGECEGEAGVVLFVAFGGGVVVVVAEVELQADAARDLREFDGVGGVGGELIAFVVGDGDGVEGVFSESAAGVDDVFGAEAGEGVEVGGGVSVEEPFVDERGSDAAVELEFFPLEEKVTGADGGGGAEGNIFDGVVEFVIFAEGVPAFGGVKPGEDAAVDGVERGLVGGLDTVDSLVIALHGEGEFLGLGVVFEVRFEGVGGGIGIAGGVGDAEGELIFPMGADGEIPGFEIKVIGLGGDGHCGWGGRRGGYSGDAGGRGRGFGFAPAGAVVDGGDEGGVRVALR